MPTIFANGINQGDLVDLLVSIKTKFNAILVKLDADTAVAETDYNSTLALTIPDGLQTSDPKSIRDQGVVVTFLQAVITNFNLLVTKLDADSTVTDTDYVSLWTITDVVDGSLDGVKQIGLFQSSLVSLLDTIISKINGLNAKLDLDATATDFVATCNVTDNIDSAGTQARCI